MKHLENTVTVVDRALEVETLELIDGTMSDVVERDPAKVILSPSVSTADHLEGEPIGLSGMD